MKTTLNIPDDRMDALLKATRAKTRTEAINKAIEEYIYQENVKKVMELAGTGGYMTREELQAMRKMELNETQADSPSK
jgi:metal-responsive CopG/Arc/MetJ family transcriptional regulator